MGRGLALLAVAILAMANYISLGQAAEGNTTNPRLGLLASSLGVPPVPGASYGGGGDDIGTSYSGPDTGTSYSGGDAGGTAYSVGGGGGNYGPPVSPQVQPLQSCKCAPRNYCKNPQPYPGGGSQGGNYGPGPAGGTGGNYGPGPAPGGAGGNYGPGPVENTGGSYGPGPVVGGGGGGNYGPGPVGGGGGNYGPEPAGGSYGPGPGPSGNYGPEPAGGNYGPAPAVEKPYPAGPSIGGGKPGGSYGGDNGEGTDGSGLIDIRIVNRPPGTGHVACLGDDVWCCDGDKVQPYPSGPGPEPYPVAPIQGGCGVRQIIPVKDQPLEYGQAQFGAYPWMAVMLGPNNNYLGAGALIDPYHVLTAAHKIYDYKGGFKVRFGEWNAAADDEPYKNVEVDAANVLIHPAFNNKNLQNDVAIITLAQPVSLDAYPHIKSVCLPQQGTQYVGQRCWVAGFGKDAFQVGKHSYILREVDVPVVQSDECEERLRSTRLGHYFNLNRKSFLCAGGEEGKDACTGDGGSPLVCEYNGKFTVVGLVAWGIGCADYGIPGVYVNVPNYVNWIESNLGPPHQYSQPALSPNKAPAY